MNKHTTIHDVATAAGVSITTVSRTLNNKPDVAPKTRQRVLTVIAELGYAPHASAQNLAAGRSRSIAVLYPMDSLGFSGLEFEFFLGIAAVTGKNEFLFNMIFQPMTESGLLNLYRSNQVDGLIMMEIHLNDWRPRLLNPLGYPFVMIGHCEDNTGLSYVDLDFEASLFLAVKYLYELGHRRIAFLNLTGTLREQSYGPSVRSLHGYQRACEQYGLVPIMGDAPAALEDVCAATESLLTTHPDLTAITTLHTDSLMGIIRTLQRRGLDVPLDVSLIGIIVDKVAQLITPPLTAISFPAQTMGTRAAKMLLQMLQDPASMPKQVLLPPKLIARDSTAPARES
jgi:DNA-binding LacI/PurR family transcriptional regulator